MGAGHGGRRTLLPNLPVVGAGLKDDGGPIDVVSTDIPGEAPQTVGEISSTS